MPGPSWPRGCSAPTRSTPSWATGSPPSWCSALPRATIDQAASADTVVVLSGDVREELPILFLRLRAGRRRRGTLPGRAVAPRPPRSPPYAKVSLRYAPGEAAAVATALVDPAAAGPASVDPGPLAEARRLAGAGQRRRRRRAAVPGRGRCPGGRGRPGPGRCAPEGPLPSRPAAGQRATAPSTWGWLPGSCPAG